MGVIRKASSRPEKQASFLNARTSARQNERTPEQAHARTSARQNERTPERAHARTNTRQNERAQDRKARSNGNTGAQEPPGTWTAQEPTGTRAAQEPTGNLLPDDHQIHKQHFRRQKSHSQLTPCRVDNQGHLLNLSTLCFALSVQDGVDFLWCIRLIMSNQKIPCLSRDNELWIIRSWPDSWNMWSWNVNWQVSSRSRRWVKAKVAPHSPTTSSTRNTVSNLAHVTTLFIVISFLSIEDSCWRNTHSPTSISLY